MRNVEMLTVQTQDEPSFPAEILKIPTTTGSSFVYPAAPMLPHTCCSECLCSDQHGTNRKQTWHSRAWTGQYREDFL